MNFVVPVYIRERGGGARSLTFQIMIPGYDGGYMGEYTDVYPVCGYTRYSLISVGYRSE